MIFPRPTNQRNMYYYISFQKKMSNEMLEKFCGVVVDTLYFDLGKREFFICTLQGKNGNIYLRIKKQGRVVNNQNNNIFIQKIFNCIKTCFNFYCQKDQLLKEKYFIDFRLINKSS